MKRQSLIRYVLLAIVLILALFSNWLATGTRAATTPTVDVINAARFHDDGEYLYAADIQAFLEVQGSALANYYVYFPISDEKASAANVIAGAALRNNLNPKVLLTLIEMQTQLISTRPARLGDMKYPFGKDSGLPEGFADQVWAMSAQLNQEFVRFAVESEAQTVATDTLPQMNAASLALQAYLGETTDDFAAVYSTLFSDVSTSEPTLRVQAVSLLALTSPYEGAYDDEITALFDHEYPTYENGTYITVWTGDNIPGATFALCQLGYNCYTGHDSYDYGIEADSNIIAAEDGTVVFIGPDCAGQTVTLLHDGGYRTSYWHLHTPLVSLNQQVNRGDRIGLSGGDQGGCSTGAHLHFNVTLNNKDTDPFGWEGGYPEPCVVNNTCAPGQFLWATEPITTTPTPTLTPTPTPTASPTPLPIPSNTPTPTPVAHTDGDSFEPDEYPALAKTIQPYVSQEHSIMPLGDQDWVTFTVNQYSAINIWTNGLTNADTELALYDANLRLIERNDDYTVNNHYSRIDRVCNADPLPPGQYYVKTTQTGSMYTIDSYMLEFMAFTCTTWVTPTPTVMPQVFVPLINANGGPVTIAGEP